MIVMISFDFKTIIVLIYGLGLGLWRLKPLSTIFQFIVEL
jgi:hypothetical protein